MFFKIFWDVWSLCKGFNPGVRKNLIIICIILFWFILQSPLPKRANVILEHSLMILDVDSRTQDNIDCATTNKENGRLQTTNKDE